MTKPNKIITPTLTHNEEIAKNARARIAVASPFNIDRWPEEVTELSMPTTLIPVDAAEFTRMYDGDESVMSKYAAKIDDVTGWDRYFMRLNTRSPKDATHPALPVTCSGKQAMLWFATSMRAMDDSCLMALAGEPLFIAVREFIRMMPETEFRCFAKDGKFIAVSRYHYRAADLHIFEPGVVVDRADEFYQRYLAKHYETVVYDLAFDCRMETGVRDILIELNPYGLSDPCCFGCYENVEKIGGYAGEMLV